MKNILTKTLFLVVIVAPCINNVIAYEVASASKSGEFDRWHQMHSTEGSCKATFPRKPEHMQQEMQVKGNTEKVRYNVYVADHQKKEVFMVLIANYPGELKKQDAKHHLENFLNTLVSQNEKNRLLFADLVEVDGNPGMDFFIRTESIYFKGRAIQANNSLYLLAMECEIKNYQEHHFNYFIESFTLDK